MNLTQLSTEESLSLDGPPDATVTIGGKNYQYHAGNGYLGLQAHPELLATACEAVLRYGIGTATTRAAFTSPPVFQVQRKVADSLGMDQAYYFSSGYLANQILLEMLIGTFDRIFIDEASHSSLFDAIKVARGLSGKAILFSHRNSEDLKQKLDQNLRPNQRPLVLTDGIFPALGKIAPLHEYDQILSDYEDASVLIDDAQGFGILGDRGRGTLEYFNLQPCEANKTADDFGDCQNGFDSFGADPTFFIPDETIPQGTPVRYYFTATLSKAIGGCGGIIPGSDAFIQRILERSRTFYGEVAPPSPIAAATCKGLELTFERTEIRNSLMANTRYLKTKLKRLGLPIDPTPVPIIPLQLGSANNMRRIQRQLSQAGLLVAYLPRSAGAGPDGTLRIAVFATHTTEMLDILVEHLKRHT
ncbi:MAG: aminotransferase class I/II-fold pyridoxal phosphate-dependent enzyme [Thermoguttaceae bacterium]